MNTALLGGLGLLAMLGLVAIRVPIAFCMATVGFVGMIVAVGWPEGRDFDFDRGFDAAWAYISFEPFSFIANFPIVAVPLFLLMGYVAFHAGFTQDIYYAARVWLSRLYGGLAMASVAGCAMFAAVSGSSLATAAAMVRGNVDGYFAINTHRFQFFVLDAGFFQDPVADWHNQT